MTANHGTGTSVQHSDGTGTSWRLFLYFRWILHGHGRGALGELGPLLPHKPLATTPQRLLPRPMLRQLSPVHCLRTVQQAVIYPGAILARRLAKSMARLFPRHKLDSGPMLPATLWPPQTH